MNAECPDDRRPSSDSHEYFDENFEISVSPFDDDIRSNSSANPRNYHCELKKKENYKFIQPNSGASFLMYKNLLSSLRQAKCCSAWPPQLHFFRLLPPINSADADAAEAPPTPFPRSVRTIKCFDGLSLLVKSKPESRPLECSDVTDVSRFNVLRV